MTALDDLLNYIFDGNRSALYREFEGWVRQSRRFKAFAMDHRTKIRAKLKSARGEDRLRDLRAELETAMLLLREARFTLEYEKYAALKQRGPDFAITFKTHTPFHVEVRRIDLEDNSAEARLTKLIGVLCDKVGQMQPSAVNLLWLVADKEISEADLNQAAVTLRQLAERKAEDFFKKRGFESAAAFLRQYQRLSAIVLHQSGENMLWLNPLARHKTPPEIANTIQRLKML